MVRLPGRSCSTSEKGPSAIHAFVHLIDAPPLGLFAFGAIGVYLSRAARLERIAKAGFCLTLAGFGPSAASGLAIMAVDSPSERMQRWASRVLGSNPRALARISAPAAATM